jgi:NADPH2:quinone reductase
VKALICREYGLPLTLQVEEVATPTIEPDEVLVKVLYCGVNFPDTLIIQNKYQFKAPLPFTPGSEITGIVTAVGKEVIHVKPGDRVAGICRWGGFAEFAAIKSTHVFVLSANIDLKLAAATLYNYATSYHALKDRAQLKPGEKLLVLGAAGGVGLAALELGKLMGATVIAAASTDEKLNLCNQKGADSLINYATHNLRELVKEITNGAGVNVVFDPAGGALAENALRSMAWRGRYLVVGFASGTIPAFPANVPLLKGASVIGVFWSGFAAKEPMQNATNIKQLIAWLAEGKIKQEIYKTYSLPEAPQALQALMDRKVLGKAIVQVT